MQPSQKAFYPEFGDNRQNIYEVKDPQVQEAAKSVCCFVKNENMEFDEDKKIYTMSKNIYNLSERYFLKYGFELRNRYEKQFIPLEFDKAERFLSESIFAFGTGFLITSNKIMTAYHVVKNKNLGEISIVFDFVMKNRVDETKTFPQRNVYKIKSIYNCAQYSAKGYDWAIVETDREIDRAPLILNKDEKIFSDHPDPIRMLGFPLGLPLKYVEKGKVTYCDQRLLYKFHEDVSIRNRLHNTFSMKIAACHGNSGSPIFDRNWKVIGILVAGENDLELIIEKTFRFDICEIFGGKCFTRKAYIRSKCITEKNSTTGGVEVAQAIQPIKDYLP